MVQDNIQVITDDAVDEIPRDSRQIIPIESIIEYRKKGLSYSEIAAIVGCSKQNVHTRLQTISYNPLDNDNFIKNRAEVFAFIQSRFLNSLDEQAIQDMSPYQRIIAMGILFDKERLERGESSSNVSISLSNRLQKALKRRQTKVIDVEPTTTAPDASHNALPVAQPVVSTDTKVK